MKHHTCTDCGTKIPNGEAYIRSVSFELITLCRECAPTVAPKVPAQRSALGERLVSARRERLG